MHKENKKKEGYVVMKKWSSLLLTGALLLVVEH